MLARPEGLVRVWRKARSKPFTPWVAASTASLRVNMPVYHNPRTARPAAMITHTLQAWVSVPPCPQTWRGRTVRGWEAWPQLAEPLAQAITARLEQYAPGFRDLIIEHHTNTALDQERNNPPQSGAT